MTPPVVNQATIERGCVLTLLDICSALHADNAGICDPMEPRRRRELVGYLRHRIANWKSGLARTNNYDQAVLALCKATIKEKHWSEP